MYQFQIILQVKQQIAIHMKIQILVKHANPVITIMQIFPWVFPGEILFSPSQLSRHLTYLDLIQ